MYSQVERQIDFAIRGNLAGKRILGIVDSKYYSKKIDVKTIESFIGMMEDVNASFGFMITNKGYSQAAKNRVKFSNLKLDVLTLNELNEVEITVDYFFNQSIKGLQLSKSEFFRRNNQNSVFFDQKKSNYRKRIICFKEGFANTEFYAKRKLLENTVRAFRDFDQLRHVKVFIPAVKNSKTTSYSDKRILYSCSVKRSEVEDFLKINIDHFRDDIEYWRKYFLGKISQDLVNKFTSQFIIKTHYDDYDKITLS